MAHVRIEDSGHRYRLSLSDESWVCSEGPLQEAVVRTLNREAPITRYISPVYPDPENEAMRSAVAWLEGRSMTILTIAYNTVDPVKSDPNAPRPNY